MHEGTLLWKSKSNANQRPPFGPRHFIESTITTNPYSNRNGCEHEDRQDRGPVDQKRGDHLTSHVDSVVFLRNLDTDFPENIEISFMIQPETHCFLLGGI